MVAIPPVLQNTLPGLQYLAAQHTVKGRAGARQNAHARPGIPGRGSPAAIPHLRRRWPPPRRVLVRQDVPPELGEGEELLVTAAALDQVALLVELPPVVGGVLDQLILCLSPATAVACRDLLAMHIQQVELHVSKGGCGGLAAAALDLELYWIHMLPACVF